MKPLRLNNQNLASLPQEIRRPGYDRTTLSPGIVHIGVGNFHRAHQSWYLHRLFEMGLNHDWAIIGAGVRPYDAQMRLKIQEQDYLSTLIELAPAGQSTEVVGSMINYLPVEESNGSLIAQMADPSIRIVSLTVTEGGYYFDPATKSFKANHPDIQHDASTPETPRTAFGAIIAALKRRMATGVGPFTCLCCDNLQNNGSILRQTLVSLAGMSDPELAKWIDNHCTFPNSMVDCIVPATGQAELVLVHEINIHDEIPVSHENFRQWVIEDDFCAGRPDLEKVGVTFTEKVHDFEKMKIRILNGGHQVIADVAEILGIETIAQAMAHPQIRDFLHKVAMEEIVPHVKPVPGYTPEEYVQLVMSRFSNPKIVDTTRRVAFDGSSRHPGFIIPTIQDGLFSGTPIVGLALVSAAWARYCLGKRENGSIISANDPNWDELSRRSAEARKEPRQWLLMHNIYGDLADQEEFCTIFTYWLNSIYSNGLEATLDIYLENNNANK